MLFWNRIEIYNGFSEKEFIELQNSLKAANIPFEHKIYKIKKAMQSNTNGSAINNPGSHTGVKYALYVHQKDYEQAMHFTSNRNNLAL